MNQNNIKMTARKKVAKKAAKKRRVSPKAVKKDLEPDYMVQLAEPKMLRKDLLESLREVIIFMQGYEKFRKIQEEKVTMFNSLKLDVKSLNTLINDKLRKYLPKGKLQAVLSQKKVEEQSSQNEMLNENLPSRAVEVQPTPSPQVSREPSRGSGGLMELEYQLKDIERQLQSIK